MFAAILVSVLVVDLLILYNADCTVNALRVRDNFFGF